MNAQTTPTQNAPLFSVIVPIYNVQNYLGECLDSILAQDCDDFELLLINDGSTDDSLEIAQKYAAMDTRITLISQANTGQSAARNAGLAIAKGEYLVFVDSDDLLKNGALSHYKEIFQTYHCEIIYTEFDCVADDGIFLANNPFWFNLSRFGGAVHSGDSLLSSLFEAKKPLFTYTWQGAIQRRFIEQYNICFYHGIPHQDILFGMTCFSLAQSVYLSTKRFYQYRQSLISTTRGGENDIKKLTKSATSHAIIAHELLALLQTPQINKSISPTTQKFYYRCVGTILKRLVRMLAKLPNNQIKYELIQNIKPLFAYIPLKLKPKFLYYIIRSKSYASLPSKEI